MRERLILVGTSFRHVGFDRLGGYVLPPDDTRLLADLKSACCARGIVYIATCNRVEIYLSADVAFEAGRARAAVAEFFAARAGGSAAPGDLFELEGEDALVHLLSVVASLDSLVLGECEIAGQVRRAAERATSLRLADGLLERVFQRASRAAKRVRTETAIGRTPVSVASLVLRRMREHFGDAPPENAVLVGVGDVTKKVAAALEAGPTRLLFVNRTESRAAELAARYGGASASLERFLAAPPDAIDLLVTATRAPEAIIDAATLGPALARPPAAGLLVCDLGIPPDVDPAIGADPRVRLLTLPDLEATAQENRARLAGEVEHVRAIVAEEARRFAIELRAGALGEESAEALLRGRLGHLDPRDRDVVRRFAMQLAERIARQA